MTSSNPKILDDVRVIQKCLIFNRDDKVLALKRPDDDKSRAGAWDTPGGGFERGEDVIKAIRREVQEESGLNAKKLFPIYFANKIGTKIGLFSGQNVFVVCYVCHDWDGKIQLSDEHVEYKWVTPEKFIKLNFAEDEGFFAASMQTYLSK